MDQAKKIKIILVSVFSLLLLGVVYLFIRNGSNGDKPNEVSARAIDSAEVSINDIMAQNDKAPLGGYTPTPEPSLTSENPISTSQPIAENSEYESSEDIAKLQQQLRENMRTRRDENTQSGYYESSKPSYQPVAKGAPRVSESTSMLPSAMEEKSSSSNVEESIEEQEPPKRSRFNSGLQSKTKEIKVLVLGEQELRNDAPLKMVLAQSINLEGVSIPKGTALYGIIHSSNGRMNVSVSSIRYRERSFSVSLNVYDRDGLKGINIQDPGQGDNTVQEVAEDVAQRTGIISGAVGTITSTISGIFRRKGSSSTIIIKSNYQLALR